MASNQAQFDEFIERISLKQRHVERIETATGALSTHLSDKLSVETADIFTQGSYANGTAIRPPESGAYDVDLIVISADEGSSAKGALDNLFGAIADHGRYKDRLEAKTPCVRVNYADDDIGSFHVDVVPVRESEDIDAPLDAPRRNAGWHPTAPAEFTIWCGERGGNFARTVKALKRWRNEQQEIEKAIKSIVLQVLVDRHMPTGVAGDAERLTATLESMDAELSDHSSAPVISNPVLPSENLAARWSWSHFKDFGTNLREAGIAARNALNESDSVTSAQLWKELLGKEFPLPTADESSLSIEDFSHREPLGSQRWVDSTGSRPSFDISARVLTSHRRKVIHERYQGGALKAGWTIRFEAKVALPVESQVWWQVTNTGAHAKRSGCLRGGFHQAKDHDGTVSRDPRINWERTEYTGSHLVQAYVVDKLGLVVAKSDTLRVDVWNPTWRLGR